MIPDWVSFLAYPNLFGIKGFVGGGGVVVVVGKKKHFHLSKKIYFLQLPVLTVKVCSTFLISARRRFSSIKGSFAIPFKI
jgi:hypothetical protein